MQVAAAALANSVIMKEFTRECNPTQSSGGPAPAAFVRYRNEPGSPAFSWPQVPGAVAYVVNRAIDGTTDWKVAGTTCGSPHDIQLSTNLSPPTAYFQDVSGGIIPGTTYVYQVKAFGASGEMEWNSTRWTSYAVPVPVWKSPVITGSIAKLAFVLPVPFGISSSDAADEWKLIGPDGRTWNGTVKYSNTSTPITVTVLGLPVGTHTFTVIAIWRQSLDSSLPSVTASSSSQQTITITM